MANKFNDTVNLSAVIGTSFSGVSLKPLRPKYIFDALCNSKEWNLNTNPNRGDAITFTTISAWSSNTGALTPTTATITGSQYLSKTRRSVSLELYGDHTVIDTLELKAESFQDEIADAAFNLADQAGNSLNLLARTAMDLNKYSNEASGTLSSTYHCYGTSTAGFNTSGTMGKLTAATVRAVVAKLRAANVKPFGDGLYYAIVHPNQYTQLRSDAATQATWTSSKQYVESGASDMFYGDAGIFEGCRFIINDQVKALTNTISAYFVGQEFVGKGVGLDLRVATNPVLAGPHANLLTMFWDVLCGYKVLRREAGIIVSTKDDIS